MRGKPRTLGSFDFRLFDDHLSGAVGDPGPAGLQPHAVRRAVLQAEGLKVPPFLFRGFFGHDDQVPLDGGERLFGVVEELFNPSKASPPLIEPSPMMAIT